MYCPRTEVKKTLVLFYFLHELVKSFVFKKQNKTNKNKIKKKLNQKTTKTKQNKNIKRKKKLNKNWGKNY